MRILTTCKIVTYSEDTGISISSTINSEGTNSTVVQVLGGSENLNAYGAPCLETNYCRSLWSARKLSTN